jgi:hypothetical protein
MRPNTAAVGTAEIQSAAADALPLDFGAKMRERLIERRLINSLPKLGSQVPM